jgi:hypothetical protein
VNKVSVDNGELLLDDVIEDFAEHLERYDIASRDAENVWLTITQEVHDRRLTIKMKIERLPLLADNFAFVVNLDIVRSIEIGSEELEGGEDADLPSHQAGEAGGEEESSDDSDSSSGSRHRRVRVQHEHSTKRTLSRRSAGRTSDLADNKSVHSSVTSNRSSSLSENDQRHREQEQLIFSWLRRSTLLALVLVCTVAIAGMVYALDIGKQQTQEMTRMDRSARRGKHHNPIEFVWNASPHIHLNDSVSISVIDLVSIAYYTRELDLLRRGFVDASQSHQTSSGTMAHEEYIRYKLKYHAVDMAEASRLINHEVENSSTCSIQC